MITKRSDFVKKLTAVLFAAFIAMSLCITVFADFCITTYPDVTFGHIAVDGSHENPSTGALCSNTYCSETVVRTMSFAEQRFDLKGICTVRSARTGFEIYELKCSSCNHVFALMLRAK